MYTDTLGSLTHSTNTSEQLHTLRNLTSTDHVHLTDDGYKAMAVGLLKEATSLRAPREKGLNKGLTRQPTITWNGFTSHSGIGKTSLNVVRKQANPRHTPYHKKNYMPLCHLCLSLLKKLLYTHLYTLQFSWYYLLSVTFYHPCSSWYTIIIFYNVPKIVVLPLFGKYYRFAIKISICTMPRNILNRCRRKHSRVELLLEYVSINWCTVYFYSR